MKIRDYWRLAKESLAARKKSTKSTVRGMAFSLVILVPLLFAVIGLNQNILAKLNKEPEQLYASCMSAEAGNRIQPDRDHHYSIPNYYMLGIRLSVDRDHSAFFDSYERDTLHYSIHVKDRDMQSGMPGGENDTRFYEKIFVDGVGHHVLMPTNMQDGRDGKFFSTLAVVDNDDMGLFAKNIKSVYVDGCDKGFSGDGKRQVILSKEYIASAGLKPEDVYGKKVGVYFKDRAGYTMKVIKKGESSASGEEVDSLSHYLFEEFDCVGVISAPKYSGRDIRSSSIIVTGSSYYDASGNAVLAPKVVKELDGQGRARTTYLYEDYESMKTKTRDYVFSGSVDYPYKSDVSEWEDKEVLLFEPNLYMYFAKDYADLNKATKEIFKEYKADWINDESMMSYIGSDVFNEFQNINNIFSYVMLGGGIVAGTILFAALVNLFNSIKHSVDSRRNYLGVMKAVGARSSTIPKLYFFEVMRIFLRVFVRVLIIGTLLCVTIMLVLHYTSAYMPMSFTISWTTIPLVMGILAGILVVIGISYSLICSYSLSRRPITELLEG